MFATLRATNSSCISESCPGTAALKEFLDQEINEHGDDEKLNYCQWDTTNQAILTAFTTTCEE